MALSTIERERQWQLPNLLTYGRMVAVPVVAACLFAPDEFAMRWLALMVFIVAGITDFFDGYLAREFLAELRVSVPVTKVAKWKTAVQLVAVGFLIAGPAGEVLIPGTVTIGLVLFFVSAFIKIYTGWDYMKAGFRPIAP